MWKAGVSAAVALLVVIAPLGACAAQGPEDCQGGDKWSGEICAEAIIVDFKACTGTVASSLTQEQRVRLEGEVTGALKAVGGKGAVEFANKLARETSDPVNLKVIDTCFELVQRSGIPENTQAGIGAARQVIETKVASLPTLTLAPPKGKLTARVRATGHNWPPRLRLTITAAGEELINTSTKPDGTFDARLSLQKVRPVMAEGKAIVTVTVSPTDDSTNSQLTVAAAYEVIPEDNPGGSSTVTTSPTKSSPPTPTKPATTTPAVPR